MLHNYLAEWWCIYWSMINSVYMNNWGRKQWVLSKRLPFHAFFHLFIHVNLNLVLSPHKRTVGFTNLLKTNSIVAVLIQHPSNEHKEWPWVIYLQLRAHHLIDPIIIDSKVAVKEVVGVIESADVKQRHAQRKDVTLHEIYFMGKLSILSSQYFKGTDWT